VVRRIQAEHPDRERLRVALYPCSPLQCLQPAPPRETVASVRRVGEIVLGRQP
jgi:hypothetical protein